MISNDYKRPAPYRTPSQLKNLTSLRVGSLFVLGFSHFHYPDSGGKRKAKFLCKCDCGNYTTAMSTHLTTAKSNSCGKCVKYICLHPGPWRVPNEVKNDLTGKIFSRLTVLGFNRYIRHKTGKYAIWMCRCDCGEYCTPSSSHLTSGHSTSCGCYLNEIRPFNRLIHGMAGTTEYKIWLGMKERCLNPVNHAYHLYGGAGVTIHKPWLVFENFYADMGARPSLLYTLDRYHPNWKPGDHPLPYSPNTCRWATRKQQARNRSVTLLLSDGRILSEVCEDMGLRYHLVYSRLFLQGWCEDCSLNLSINQTCKHKAES